MQTKLIIGAAAAALLGGCVAQQNDRLTIGRTVRLETFYPPEPTPAQEGAAVLAAQPPTLTSVWRDNWEPTLILTPIDGTAHQTTYNKRLHLTENSARQRREYPTAASALELTEGSEQDQQFEAVSNQLYAIADAILLIPRMIIDPPWSIRWSPDVAYQRYWAAPEPPAAGPAVESADVVTPSQPDGPPPSAPAPDQPR